MSGFEIYHSPLKRIISVNHWNLAIFFTWILTVCSLFIPFLICFRSGGFWIRDLTYLEQPRVKFLRQCYCEIRGNPGVHTWSTLPQINAQLSNSLQIPYMTVSEVDEDNDGRFDHMNLNLRIRTQFDVTSVYLVLFYELQLDGYTKLTAKFPVIVQSSMPTNFYGSRFFQTSALRLHLSRPLVQGQNNREYNYTILDNSEVDARSLQAKSIQQELSERAVTMSLDDQYALWTPGSSSLSDPFVINLTVLYKPVTVWTHPGFWTMIWWGWVQYFPILLVSLFISDRIKAFAFEHHLFDGCVITRDPLLSQMEH